MAPSGDQDPAFEPLEGEAIDIGEAIAQEFSLALPPFPRADDALWRWPDCVRAGRASRPASPSKPPGKNASPPRCGRCCRRDRF
jgi:hypothetical protein